MEYSQSIGDYAFALCTSLKSVTLNSPYITAIGMGAFADCGDNLELVTIGSRVESIGNGAFSSRGNGKTATGVGWFEVQEDNPSFCDIDGVLYQKLDNGTYALLMCHMT